jgi:hypothetical protein
MMKKNCLSLILLLAVLGILSTPSPAKADRWGVSTWTEITYTNLDQTAWEIQYSGDPNLKEGVTSSHDSANLILGEAEAWAQLQAGGITPVLKARSEFGIYNLVEPGINVQEMAYARARAQEVYLYTGTESKEFTLTMYLNGSLQGADASLLGSIIAKLGSDVYELENPILGSAYSQLDETGEASESFTFTINPGDFFTVISTLTTSVGQMSEADAYNSLSMSFSDPTGLIPQSTPSTTTVPLPAAVWLFGTGLLGLFSIRRKIGK